MRLFSHFEQGDDGLVKAERRVGRLTAANRGRKEETTLRLTPRRRSREYLRMTHLPILKSPYISTIEAK
jgi:hypothetical protein